MKDNIIIVIVTIALTWFCVWFFSNDKDIKNQLENVIEQRKELTKEINNLQIENDSLKKIEQAVKIKYVYVNNKISTNEKDIKDVNDYVYSLNEQSIDSTIRHYTHKPYITK